MKKLILMLSVCFCTTLNAQKTIWKSSDFDSASERFTYYPSTKDRYFQAMFIATDSTGILKYGTYYLTTQDGYFPTLEIVQKLIIDAYRIKISYDSKEFAFIISEFKNKDEFLKFNHKRP